MTSLFKRLYASILGGILLMACSASAAVVTANFSKATDIPVTASSYTATGNTVNITLNFTPAVGTTLTVVKSTGLNFVQGVFGNLAQGQVVNLTNNGISYAFVATYFGGSGNDIVLQWVDTKAYGWGNNASGQLGLGNASVVRVPAAVTTTGALAGKTIVSISTGSYYSLALCADGTVAAWGRNKYGQLGNNSTTNTNVPVDITGSGVLSGKTVVAISAGYEHSLALCSDGTVASWGNNGNGELGNGGNDPSFVPVAVVTSGVLAGRKVVAISAGQSFSLALCSDGGPVTWGTDGNGQLGQSTAGSESNVPLNVTRSGALAGKTVSTISAGSSHVLALCTDGTLTAWGSNYSGETGGATGSLPRLVSPLGILAGKTVTSISAGDAHSIALCTDGTVAAWGDSNYGQLGNGSVTSDPNPTPTAVSRSGVLAGKSVIAISAGYTHSVALCSDGTLVGWGDNRFQQMGNQSSSSQEPLPVAVATSPLHPRKAVALATGPSAYHTFALAALPSPAADSELISLIPSAGNLEPAFAPGTLNYWACVPNSTSSITLTATTSSAAASIAVNGTSAASGNPSQSVALAPGNTAVNVTVTAADGSMSTYGINVLRPESLNVNYTSAGMIPVTFPAYDATGLTASLSLGFAPPNGTNLVLVKNSGLRPITGRFSNLPQGSTVDLTFNGGTYTFVADYFGGSGNDLVLRWANCRLYAFGSNTSGQLGNNSQSNSNLAVPVTDSGVLAGKIITAMSVGSSHTLALCADGTIAAWGSNSYGQLGNGSGGSNIVSKVPVAVVASGALAGKTVSTISAGGDNSLALCTDGTVVAWGNNNYGQLGNTSVSTSSYSKVPVPVDNTGVLAGRPVVAIAAGANFSLALCADGKMAAWGLNYRGQLGNNSGSTNSGLPVAVDTSAALAGKSVTSISAGSGFSLALCTDGTVVSWGGNDFGQLGEGSTNDSKVPVIVKSANVLGGKTVTAISAGGSHGFALCADGTFAAWGSNDFGVFGNNSNMASTVPVLIPPFGALVGKTVTAIIAGTSHSLALCSDGTAAGWGSNSSGQGGNGTNTSTTTPVLVSTAPLGAGEIFTALAPGASNHAVVLVATPPTSSLTGLTDLVLGSGVLTPAFSGTITAYTSSVPNATNSITVTPTAINADVTVTVNGRPVVSGTASSPVPLSEGANTITVVATSPDGTTAKTYTVGVTRGITLNAHFTSATTVPVTAAGFTASGSVINLSLGYAPVAGTVLTVVNNTGPAFIGGEFSNLAQFQAVNLTFGNVTYNFIANYFGGNGNDLVLMWASGKTYTWGSNFHGELGNNSTTNSRVPVPIDSGPLAGKAIVRLATGTGHSLAACSDGTLAAWGDNSSRQLGNGLTADSRVPVSVISNGVLSGKTVISIAGGESHSLALCSDGKLVAWGGNGHGQLGTGSISSSPSAVPVAVATNGALAGKVVTAIAVGSSHNLALCSDGTVAAWGVGNSGQLGNSTNGDANTPFAVTNTGALKGKTVVAIAAGVGHSLALCSDGTLAAWGLNANGQLGNNSTISSNVPVAIGSFGALDNRTVVAIGAGGYHSLALRSDGILVSWGLNSSGQLGINSTTDSKVPVAVNATGVLKGKTIMTLSGGRVHSLALCSDGTLAAWGENYSGQLGNNTITGSNVPVATFTQTFATGGKYMSLGLSSTADHSMAIVALPLPSATTLAASAVTGTGATLNGRVNATGNVVAVSFEYGRDTGYGTTATASPASVSGGNDTAVTTAIAGLAPGTLYHYRVVATSAGGIVRGVDMTFTTLSDNTNLASLDLSTGSLLPAFEKNTIRYTATVPFGTSGVRVTPVTEHPGATVTVNGRPVISGTASVLMDLSIGNTRISTVVTAQDGITSKTYIITVTRLPEKLTFDSATSVPVTADGFSTGGYPVEFFLNYPPVPGTILTAVNNTGLAFIDGTFGNLAQGQHVGLTYAGITYDFVANYFGGTGNDLVLQWAATEVHAWGANHYGQLGDNSSTGRLAPVATDDSGVLVDKTIFSVAGGYLHSLALCSDGTLASWGYNVYGQLGNGGTAASPVPVVVDRSGALDGKTVIAISAGPFHNLALCSDGSIAAWGYNNNGQLGTGDKTTHRAPVLVNPVGALVGKQVVGIAAGVYQSFARCADGSVVAWGYNDEGELGDNSTDSRLVPVDVDTSGVLANKKVAAISAGQYHTVALCTDGTLVAWGYNQHGELGNNSVASSKVPVAIGSFGILAGKSVSAIAAGGSHSLALCTDGTLAAWGANNQFQLGTTGTGQSLIPIQVSPAGATLGKTILRIAAGGANSMALCSDGSLAAWGDNRSGQLGNNSTTTSEVPSSVDSSDMAPGSRFMWAATGNASLHAHSIVGVPSQLSNAQASQPPAGVGIPLPPLGDDDHDGIPNLVERAFGLDPAKDSSGKLPSLQLVGEDHVIEFDEPTDAAGITYGVEISGTMLPGTWSAIADSGEGSHHIFIVPADSGQTMFFRLKVTE